MTVSSDVSETSKAAFKALAPLEAVLFDVDGTLCDSDPIHLIAFREMLLEIGFNNGVPIDEEYFVQNIAGKHNDDIAAVLFPDDIERGLKFCDDKEEYFRKLVKEKVEPIKGLYKLTKWIEERGLKRAAVTNAPRPNAELMISTLGLTDFFQFVIIGGECEHAKPAPDPYLKGLEVLNVSKEHTFICEINMKNRIDDLPTSSKIKFESSDEEIDEESASEDDGENEIHEVLANVTFEELQKARSDGSHVVNHKSKLERKGKRDNKNRPMEISSKKPVGRFREVIQAPKKVIRDTRFESLCGTLDVDGFKKRYNFLYGNELPAEKERLRSQMKNTKDLEAVSGLKERLAWIDKQLNSAATKHTDKEILVKHKKKEREAAKQGKQPYYLKKSEIRKQELVEKFKELKASGKLASFIEKKRRKNASKDHRFMPYRRENDNQQES